MLEGLKDEMKKFMQDMKDNIKDEQELIYMIERTNTLFDKFAESLENVVDYKEKEIEVLEKEQKEQRNRLDEINEKLEEVYNDMYEDDYECFGITCPYCNFKFDVNMDESAREIICPECDNIIEIDWDENIDKNENDN